MVFCGVAIIIHPLASILPISNLTGVFFIFYGGIYITYYFIKINKFLETEPLKQEDLTVFKEKTSFDLEVLIHVGEMGVSAFGHVDIWFDGKVMTYGSYDEDTYILHGLISDGVLIELDDNVLIDITS